MGYEIFFADKQDKLQIVVCAKVDNKIMCTTKNAVLEAVHTKISCDFQNPSVQCAITQLSSLKYQY